MQNTQPPVCFFLLLSIFWVGLGGQLLAQACSEEEEEEGDRDKAGEHEKHR